MDAKSDPEDIDEVHDRLQSGLQTCRSVLSNYRSLLSEHGGSEKFVASAPGKGDGEQSSFG